MVLRRWEPFGEFRRMNQNMDRLWRGFYNNGDTAPDISGVPDTSGVKEWAIPLDVVEEGDNVLVHASLPGVEPEDIDVTVENDVLTIKGHSKAEQEQQGSNFLRRERRSGSFSRSLRLPDTLDAENARPNYDNGVLTVTLPKIEAKKAKKFTVTGNSVTGTKALDAESK